MELTGDEIIEKNAKKYGHCKRNTLLPYEYEFTCVSCGFNVNKRKHELSKIQREKKFMNRLTYAEQKIYCICTDSYMIYEGNDYDEICKLLSLLKNKKIKINIILIQKYKNMLESPNFEQNYWSRTAEGIYKNGHDSIR